MNLEVSTSQSNYIPSSQRLSNKQQQSVEGMSNQSSLSARNILIQRKLMEKKRFDSADYAMNAIEASRQHEESTKIEESVSNPSMSPAQLGVSVLFNALEASEKSPNRVVSSQNTNSIRYGSLSGGNGGTNSVSNGPQSARNILLQRKLKEKKHFDSADYQLAAQQKRESDKKVNTLQTIKINTSENDDATSSDATLSGSECDSPSTSGIFYASRQNQFSPAGMSIPSSEFSRNSKYEGLSAANILLRRKLAEKKRFDSADYNMEAAQLEQKQKSTLCTDQANFSSNSSDLPLFPPGNRHINTQVPAAPVIMDVTSKGSDCSKYGKLSATNVLIRQKLRERKRFDSADYNMEHSSSSNSTKPTNEQISFEPEQVLVSQETPPSHSPMTALSQEGRLAARNVLLQRKLAERKRFDSADYFSAMETSNK
jgi:hypothetical protein